MKIEVPVKEIKGLVLRKCISSTIDYEKYDVVVSANCIVFRIKLSKEIYTVKIGDLLEQIVKIKSNSHQ